MSAFFAGLDLGQSNDYSALAVAEQVTGVYRRYSIRHLKRWKLGTPYPQIVNDVTNLFRRPPLAGSTLCIDGTVVGRAVVDLLRQAKPDARLVPIVITGGHYTNRADGQWSVPKKDLVAVMQVLFGSRRLQITPSLPEAKILAKELAAFRVKLKATTGTETFEAWREKDHDDMVLAVALPLWYAERGRREGPLLSIFPLREKGGQMLHIVVGSRAELASFDVEEGHRCLRVDFGDPGITPPELPVHPSVMDSLSLPFADLTPQDFGERWNEPLRPYGLTPDRLVMTREIGKKLWSFLAKHRDPPPDLFLFADEGGKDRRALSVALAVADQLRLLRGQTLYRAADADWKPGEKDPAPNGHVYETVKASRGMVMGEIVTHTMPTGPRATAWPWRG